MPLYKTIRVNDFTKVFVWKIEESLEDLTVGIELTEPSKKKSRDYEICSASTGIYEY